MSDPGAPVIEVQDLNVAYRHGDGWLRVRRTASVSRSRAARRSAWSARSGCGKSTVAYQLLGYRRPGSRVEGGRVLFDGLDLLRLDRPALDRLRGDRISFVPQNPTTALSPAMRVGAQIAEMLRCTWRGPTRRRRRHELLRPGRPAGAGERLRRRYPHQLSGGQQQRVCIAMALACEPDLVVLDEPTTGLDVTTQEQIIALLVRPARAARHVHALRDA